MVAVQALRSCIILATVVSVVGAALIAAAAVIVVVKRKNNNAAKLVASPSRASALEHSGVHHDKHRQRAGFSLSQTYSLFSRMSQII